MTCIRESSQTAPLGGNVVVIHLHLHQQYLDALAWLPLALCRRSRQSLGVNLRLEPDASIWRSTDAAPEKQSR